MVDDDLQGGQPTNDSNPTGQRSKMQSASTPNDNLQAPQSQPPEKNLNPNIAPDEKIEAPKSLWKTAGLDIEQPKKEDE